MPVDHYENFPVASWLLPRALRHPIATIYAFARSADDFADEGTLPPEERVRLLDGYMSALDDIAARRPPSTPLFRELDAVITQHALPLALFYNLLDAFKQDVVKTRYENFAELMDYCRRSADPIGRLLLHLVGATSPDHLARSDQICSALQLINHWQDVAIDWQKNTMGRVYLPQEDLRRFGVSEADIANGNAGTAWRALMAFECARAREMMNRGAPLGHALGGRFGAELRCIIAGGRCILDKIDAVNGDVFRARPKLNRWDWLQIAPRALLRIGRATS